MRKMTLGMRKSQKRTRLTTSQSVRSKRTTTPQRSSVSSRCLAQAWSASVDIVIKSRPIPHTISHLFIIPILSIPWFGIALPRFLDPPSPLPNPGCHADRARFWVSLAMCFHGAYLILVDLWYPPIILTGPLPHRSIPFSHLSSSVHPRIMLSSLFLSVSAYIFYIPPPPFPHPPPLPSLSAATAAVDQAGLIFF